MAIPLAITIASTGGLIRSYDGITYTASTPGGIGGNIRLLAIQGPVLYALSSAGVVWSSNNWGDSFVQRGVAVPDTASLIGLFVTSKGTYLVGDQPAAGGAVYRSINQGASWTTPTTALLKPHNFVEASSGLYLYNNDAVVGNNGLWRSTDDGVTWTIYNANGATQDGMLQLFKSAQLLLTANSSPAQMERTSQPPISVYQFLLAAADPAPVARFAGPFVIEGTDGIDRFWSAGGNEYHNTGDITVNTWVAGPLNVSSAPSGGAITVLRDQLLGLNIALAQYVVSQNHGTSWSSTGLTIPNAITSLLVPGPQSGGLNRKLRGSNPSNAGLPGGIRLPRGIPSGPTYTSEEPG